MAPGGGVCEKHVEPRALVSDGTAAPKGSHLKTAPAAAAVGKPGVPLACNVGDLLECPQCSNMMFPPILQCPNGHTLCSECKARIQNACPICGSELGNIRCLALEKVAELLELPCRYQDMGCPDLCSYFSKLRHEKSCRFRPFSCPYVASECSATGDIPFLVKHLKEVHRVDMHDGCSFNHRYIKSNPEEVENATWMLTVFYCWGRHFCLHFEAFKIGIAPVYMAFLRYMGDDHDARKFRYILEVGGTDRKLLWQGIPRSIRDCHRKVRDGQDGLIIPRSLALFFSGGDGKELKLRVPGRIWKES